MNARLSYREVAVRGASSLRLVILLYEQAIDDLRRALAALRRHDVEGRTAEINHAILVIGHLQASLNKQLGGTPAMYLDRFYNQIRAALREAQLRQSELMLENQISYLMLLRDAWCEVERKETIPAASASDPQAPQTNPEPHPSAEWRA